MPSETPTSRQLTNPPSRKEIRPDFPRTIGLLDTKRFFEVIERELEKHGSSLDQVGHITLAYPHKHPELYPGHEDNAKEAIARFKEIIDERPNIPVIDWLTADGLVETVHLNRSGNHTSIHALMAHQIYDIHKPSQTTPLPFFDGRKEEKEFFIVLDSMVAQGTTGTNMMSYIEHNGGTVLAIAEGWMSGGKPIAQVAQPKKRSLLHLFPRSKLSAPFNDAARNTGRMEEIATVLAKSAKQDGLKMAPERCLALFEEGLNKNGNSVYAMTNGECEKLIDNIKTRNVEFSSFLKKLGVDIRANNKHRKSTAPTA